MTAYVANNCSLHHSVMWLGTDGDRLTPIKRQNNNGFSNYGPLNTYHVCNISAWNIIKAGHADFSCMLLLMIFSLSIGVPPR